MRGAWSEVISDDSYKKVGKTDLLFLSCLTLTPVSAFIHLSSAGAFSALPNVGSAMGYGVEICERCK